MPRTTVNIDASVLRELKRRARKEGKTLGQLISEIVAAALATEAQDAGAQTLAWTSKAMAARVDIEDKDALYAALEKR